MSQRNKIILAVSLLVLAGGVFFWQSGFGKPRPYKEPLQYVDVTTGKLYEIPRGRGINVLPAKNPETGEATLVPCYLNEDDGQWYVSRRKLGVVKELKDINKVVDLNSLRVSVAE